MKNPTSRAHNQKGRGEIIPATAEVMNNNPAVIPESSQPGLESIKKIITPALIENKPVSIILQLIFEYILI
jgi:hypothetical protein